MSVGDLPLGVILAGGLSRRMGGGDKALMPLGAGPLIAHVIDRLAPQVAGIAINANGDPARFAQFGLPVLGDSIDGFAGPLAGVLAGLDWASDQGATGIVTAAADTPFFPLDLVAVLMREIERSGQPLALAGTVDGERGLMRHPTFGYWPVHLRQDLRLALGRGIRKVVTWTDAHGCATVEFPSGPFDPFFNVNEPKDMDRARTRLMEDKV